MKKVLVVGVSSFVGSHAALYLRNHYRVWGTYHRHPIQLRDVTTIYDDHLFRNPNAELETLLLQYDFDAMVYCATVADEKLIEAAPGTHQWVNSDLPLRLARLQSEAGKSFIFISTSKVFSGESGSYHELAQTRPVSFYGSSKLEVEEALASEDGAVVMRLGTVFGFGFPFQHTALCSRYLPVVLNRIPTTLIRDEWRSFIDVRDVAMGIGHLIDRGRKPYEIYHFSSGVKMSYLEFVENFCRAFGVSHDFLKAGSGQDFPQADGVRRRGADLSLVDTKFYDEFSFRIRPPFEALSDYREMLKTGKF